MRRDTLLTSGNKIRKACSLGGRRFGMATGKSGKRVVLSTACLFVSCAIFSSASIAAESVDLWQVYETALKEGVDLTHTITPKIPVWVGFAESTFSPAKAGSDMEGFAKRGEAICSLSVRLALWCHDRAVRRAVAEIG
jgi:hypothetical protein